MDWNKIVNSPVFLALIGYAIAGIWWAAAMNSTVNGIQDYINKTAQHINNVDYKLSLQGDK